MISEIAILGKNADAYIGTEGLVADDMHDRGDGGWGGQPLPASQRQTDTFGIPASVPVRTSWSSPYQTLRWTSSKSLAYKIPMPAAVFQVVLLHADPFMNATGQRTFHISINGNVKETACDAFAQVGQNKPLLKTYSGIQSKSGFITISFTNITGNLFVNGIYITGHGASTLAIGGPEDGNCTSSNDALLPGKSYCTEDYIIFRELVQ